MLKLVFIAVLVSFYGNAQNFITISDRNFSAFLVEKYPNCMNGNQLDASCPSIINEENLSLNGLQISSLEGLEAFVNLKTLECLENNLTSLPALPASIVKLDCSMNQLTSLPTLPSSLEELSCAANKLTSLPSLPAQLKIIYCNFNEITALPRLPKNLEYLACGTNKITCLPTLPSSIYIGDISLNPLTCITSRADWMDEESLKLPICSENDLKNNVNRCICITTSLLSVDKFENEELNTIQLNSTFVSNNEKNSIEKNQIHASTISIFPNPTKGNIIIKSNDLINAISIKDIEGKLINLSALNQVELDVNQIELDLSELINGIYFIQTIVGSKITTYKVVKTN
jgi:hypothetical protein